MAHTCKLTEIQPDFRKSKHIYAKILIFLPMLGCARHEKIARHPLGNHFTARWKNNLWCCSSSNGLAAVQKLFSLGRETRRLVVTGSIALLRFTTLIVLICSSRAAFYMGTKWRHHCVETEIWLLWLPLCGLRQQRPRKRNFKSYARKCGRVPLTKALATL